MHPADPEAFSLVASGTSPEYVQATLSATGVPIHVPTQRLANVLAGNRHPFAVSREVPSPTPWSEVVDFVSKESGGKVIFEAQARNGRESSLFAEYDKAAVVIEREYGDAYTVTVAAASQALAHRYMSGLLTFIGEYPPYVPEPLPYNIVPVHFWMQDPMSGGGYSRRRNIEVQPFGDIAANYPKSLRDDLASLMTMDDPAGGKLVLFHGPPGGGKTRAILSLFSEWREWCGPSVVTDPDRMLADATYLNSIVFGSEGQGWLLLVIEDGDEFINVDGRDSKGQAIARLLNLADGIVGQGVNLLTLISTNVNVDQLNPALTRNGRCMANLHFGLFPEDEAREWLEGHGVEAEIEQPMSLADLFALRSAARTAG